MNAQNQDMSLRLFFQQIRTSEPAAYVNLSIRELQLERGKLLEKKRTIY